MMAAGRWKAFIPIFLALVIAAGGSYFLYNWLQQRTVPTDVSRKVEAETFPVVVAAVDLPWGTKIDNPEMLRTVPYLKSSLPAGNFSDPAKLMGRVVVSPIKATEPILEYRLASSDIKTGGIAAVVKEGMRAVSVAGNKVAGLAGLINPGNRVDVLVTTKDPKNEKETTKLVLDNVLVLAAGAQVQENPQGPSPVDVFTLEVTPIQAEQLAIAANEGNLQFALRNMLDAETVVTEGATVEEILALLRGPEVEIDIPKPKPPEPAEPPPVVKKPVVRRAPVDRSVVVEIIKGDQVGRQTFKN